MKSVVAIYPFQMISLDTGCSTYSNDNKFYFVVAIDHFTQWIEVRELRKENSEEIIQFLKDFIIYWHGCPQRSRQMAGNHMCLMQF